ncbi:MULTISPECIES: hypothetical protein [unclassified Rhizobium]|uniref:hypothetical protein n=1 Tax=unclassified Rhizobium TaxID=2613769 RepID=UPI0007E9B0F6|nr:MULTISPECIES: hypothetical protein [unclassified Rhizobium]ANL12015.1 hypothetical protein AMJ98_PA00069 [Rhizobium sp. N1341]ANM42860.1 hypothetical protein AMK03_PA00069 [Rhizobium sp. N741]
MRPMKPEPMTAEDEEAMRRDREAFYAATKWTAETADAHERREARRRRWLYLSNRFIPGLAARRAAKADVMKQLMDAAMSVQVTKPEHLYVEWKGIHPGFPDYGISCVINPWTGAFHLPRNIAEHQIIFDLMKKVGFNVRDQALEEHYGLSLVSFATGADLSELPLKMEAAFKEAGYQLHHFAYVPEALGGKGSADWVSPDAYPFKPEERAYLDHYGWQEQQWWKSHRRWKRVKSAISFFRPSEKRHGSAEAA